VDEAEEAVEYANLGSARGSVSVDELPDYRRTNEGNGHGHKDDGFDHRFISHAVQNYSQNQSQKSVNVVKTNTHRALFRNAVSITLLVKANM